MTPLSRASVSLVLVVTMLFQAGCAETRDGRKTQAQGTAIGAVGGALLGVAIGAATGNRDNIGRYAVAGAAAGGAAGFAYGTVVARRKAKYARAEDWLDQEIALAHSANNRAHAYNRSLRQRVSTLDRQIANARASKNRQELARLKTQVSQTRQAAARQNLAEEKAAEDQQYVLSDSKARGADNYSEYKREASGFREAKAERGEIMGRLSNLDNSL